MELEFASGPDRLGQRGSSTKRVIGRREVKLRSKAAIGLAKRTPRGGWPVIRFAATRDPALWDLELRLQFVDDARLRADLRENVYLQFLRHGCWPNQIGEDRLILRLLSPGDVVYDVGANIGYTSLLFAHAAGPAGKVFAFEPSPRAYRLLKRQSEHCPRITPFQLGLSDRTGTLAFNETDSLTGSSLHLTNGLPVIEVAVDTLDAIVTRTQEQPTFVKIDAEGHEASIIRGMSEVLGGKAPPTVMFEACDYSELLANITALEEVVHERVSIYGMNPDGDLVGTTDHRATNNFLAVPETQNHRLRGFQLPDDELVIGSSGESTGLLAGS